MRNYALVTGGFDPLHSGHIAYLQDAAEFGRLIVGLNSDAWLARKKGKAFMPWIDRFMIINNLKMVYACFDFDDSDGTANDFIQSVVSGYQFGDNFIFCNGGDRTCNNIPEYERFRYHPKVSFEFGVGGIEKKNASSTLLDDWVKFKTKN
jgi:cytidyltransferase-like protein